MDKASEYRAYAEGALCLASRSGNSHSEALLLKIAQGWLELAQKVETAGWFRPPLANSPNLKTISDFPKTIGDGRASRAGHDQCEQRLRGGSSFVVSEGQLWAGERLRTAYSPIAF